MSGPIKAGDWVMVVKPTPCCGYEGGLMRIFQVTTVVDGPSECLHCRVICLDNTIARMDRRRGIQIERLKKIDPPAEGDSLPTRRELEVPA